MNNSTKQLLVALSFSFFLFLNTAANHLSGGTLYYESVGPGEYIVSLVILQDCADATIVENHSIRYASDCPGLTDLGSLTVTLISSQQVLIDSCLVWPEGEICPQTSGFYRNLYQGTVSLAQDCDSYRLLFKQNYRTPSDNLDISWNSVYYIQAELDNTAQNLSSQWLNSTIPYACVGSSFQYAIEMSNPDGDDLTYEFTSALQPDGAFDYLEVEYNDGFTGESPIPGISIDSETGVINFPSPEIGKFNLAVKVSEYDNGVLKGNTMLDFLINVATCAESVYEITQQGGTVFLQDAPDDFSFQWYLNGNPISGAEDDFYVTNGTGGDYYVQITSPGGCVSESSTLDVATGLNDLKPGSFILYPNPITSNSIVELRDELLIGGSMEILDALGRLVYTYPITSLNMKLESESLDKGIFVLTLRDMKGIEQGRQQFIVGDR